MQKRHTDRYQYFKELARTSERYFMPFIQKHKHISGEERVLEIGCGEGGNLLPFAKKGCEVTGIDIAAIRIWEAKQYFAREGASGIFIHRDILNTHTHTHTHTGGYDIIIIHDVIEHVINKKELLVVASSLLAPNGIIYVGFPAWQMPFGGHQQIARNRFISVFPYIHLLPYSVYRFVLQKARESTRSVEELLDIKKCRTSVEHFKKITKQVGLKCKDEVYYFINPHYETKFGLKPRRLFITITKIPYIRNFLTSSYFCILSK